MARARSTYTNPDEGTISAAAANKPTVGEIVTLYRELKNFYQPWHEAQLLDDRFYNLLYDVAMSENPHNFEAVRPPTATTIVDMIADHTAGNFPRLHVPKRKETSKAQDRATLMQKAGQGFWYRTIASQPLNVLRAWAQSGALRGALCGSLLFDPYVWPDLPLPSDYKGGIDSDEYQEEMDEVEAQRRDRWPFVLQYVDPLDVYPDPATEGRDFVIHAFERKAYEIKRAWPDWDWTIPGSNRPVKATDWVTFISYWDRYYKAYIIGGMGTSSNSGEPLIPYQDGVQEHGYGFLPYFFISAGFGSPFGLPQFRYRGILTNIRDLLKLEARRMTHLDAIIAQQAFPWLIAKQGVSPDMQLGGITRVPAGEEDVRKAIVELRPQVPINEIVLELHENRQALQRASIPDALGGLEGKSGESGYLRSINVGTGRARIRGLGDALERMVEASTTGFYKLVENKAKAPVSVWGKGMDEEQEFVTIRPEDIDGHYEVYASLTPSLPQDDTMNIRNGQILYEHGLIPGRDFLQTYAARENAEDLLRERLGEDVLKSPQMMQVLVQDAMRVTNVTAGEIAVPGVRGAIGLGQQAAGQGAAPEQASMNPQRNAGTGIPTPPAAPGSVAETNTVIGRMGQGGAPTTPPAGPLQGIPRGR